jgi:hypothetical protein
MDCQKRPRPKQEIPSWCLKLTHYTMSQTHLFAIQFGSKHTPQNPPAAGPPQAQSDTDPQPKPKGFSRTNCHLCRRASHPPTPAHTLPLSLPPPHASCAAAAAAAACHCPSLHNQRNPQRKTPTCSMATLLGTFGSPQHGHESSDPYKSAIRKCPGAGCCS